MPIGIMAAMQPAGPACPGYTIRLLRPEDAAGVAACVRHVYGDSYVHPEVYHPDQVIRPHAFPKGHIPCSATC